MYSILFSRDFLLQECHQLLPAMLYSDKGIKDTDMNVWKYIYIQFFKIRRKIIGHDGADEYAAMLFVATFDVILYLGVIMLIDKLTNNVLSIKYEPLFFALFVSGILSIERLRNRFMCKGGAFERIKKEVEDEPKKLKWSILSILYMVLVVAFFYFVATLGNTN